MHIHQHSREILSSFEKKKREKKSHCKSSHIKATLLLRARQESENNREIYSLNKASLALKCVLSKGI